MTTPFHILIFASTSTIDDHVPHTKKHTNKGSKDGNKGQGSSLLLCHHYNATLKCLVNKQPKIEDKKK